ncbi:hypothetical protein [Flammeovirga pectinis]|uniref:hypothetical protein n=1 Tax=Flammeovirga pectinis TaxID=2494373 RepID=UPI0012D7DC91|nr:hypothetical protein [Flammeovirga pectinis]
MIAKVKYTVERKYSGTISVICKSTDTNQVIINKAKSVLRTSGHKESNINNLNVLSRA